MKAHSAGIWATQTTPLSACGEGILLWCNETAAAVTVQCLHERIAPPRRHHPLRLPRSTDRQKTETGRRGVLVRRRQVRRDERPDVVRRPPLVEAPFRRDVRHPP